MNDYQILLRDGAHIAYRKQVGTKNMGVVFLGGFRSDMEGTKAAHLAEWCAQNGYDYLRFDYFGHGASSGNFIDGTLSYWHADVLCILDELTDGAQILVGSSFGGFMALLAALARPVQIAGLLLIAPAIDMTERLIWDDMDEARRAQLAHDGVVYRASEYDSDPYPITQALIEDGRQFCLLNNAYTDKIDLTCPIRILHGQKDDAVPWALSLELVEALRSDDVRLILFKNGDHRLSAPAELDLLTTTLGALLAQTQKLVQSR